MIHNLIQSFNFWSAISGLVGTLLIFFFGLPPKIDIDGHIHLILEQENKEEKKKAKRYLFMSYVGLLLLAISFLLQLINSLKV